MPSLTAADAGHQPRARRISCLTIIHVPAEKGNRFPMGGGRNTTIFSPFCRINRILYDLKSKFAFQFGQRTPDKTHVSPRREGEHCRKPGGGCDSCRNRCVSCRCPPANGAVWYAVTVKNWGQAGAAGDSRRVCAQAVKKGGRSYEKANHQSAVGGEHGTEPAAGIRAGGRNQRHRGRQSLHGCEAGGLVL